MFFSKLPIPRNFKKIVYAMWNRHLDSVNNVNLSRGRGVGVVNCHAHCALLSTSSQFKPPPGAAAGKSLQDAGGSC